MLFASVVTQGQNKGNRKTLSQSRTPRQPPLPVQPVAQNTDLTRVLKGLNEVVMVINEIKEDLQKMDQRIQSLEDDAYYYHMGDNWEDKDTEETPIASSTSKSETQTWNTPTGQIDQFIDGMFSYKHKRPAFESPEQVQIQ